MQIQVTYDQILSSLPSGFVTAINYVVNYYDTLFTNNVTINIHIGYGEIDGQTLSSGALGESYAPQYVLENYNSVKSALQAQAAPGASALPSSSPLSGNLYMPQAEAQAMGLTSAISTSYVGFSNTASWGYTPNTTPAANQYYFVGVVEHEFTEVMGRVSLIDGQPSYYSPMDLYRFSAPGVHSLTTGGTGSTAYFSTDNGVTNLGTWNNNSSNGDLGDWYPQGPASGGHDAFNDYSSPGVINAFSANDLTLMEALGWTTTAPVVVIESAGSTSLVEVGNNYFLYPVGGSSGPELKIGGANVVVGDYGGWTPIGSEQTASGYEVAWKVTGVDAYTVWNTDSNGNYLSDTIGVVSGSSAALELLETSFHQDLNGDGVIGSPGTVIEAFGSTSLVELGNNYFLYPVGGSSGPELKIGGANVVVGAYGGWTPIGSEQTASGYEVAWKVTGVDAYTVWNTDSNGNYLSDTIGVVSGSSAALESLETSFHQDLNGDGVIGSPGTVIEAFGSTSLVELGNNYFLYPVGGSSGPELKIGGANVVVGDYGGWTPIGSEQTASGYEVAWKVTGVDAYTVWNTDSNGNYLSDTIGVVSGSSAALESLETSFHQDLNGDGVIGVPVAQQSITSVSNTNGTISTTTQAALVGTPDNDAFIFNPGMGAGAISNATSDIKTEFDGFSSAAGSSQLQAHLNDVQTGHSQFLSETVNGHNTAVNLGGHDSITVTNAQIDLHAHDFIFHYPL